MAKATTYIETGQRIRLIRKSLNLSQAAFGKQLGTDQTTISKFENGELPPSKSLLLNLITNFNISREWIENGVGEIYQTGKNEAIETSFLARPSVSIQNRFLRLVDGLKYSLEEMAEALGMLVDDFEAKIDPYFIKWDFIVSFCNYYEINMEWLSDLNNEPTNSVKNIIKRFTTDNGGKAIEDLTTLEEDAMNFRIQVRNDTDERLKWTKLTESEVANLQYNSRSLRALSGTKEGELILLAREFSPLIEDIAAIYNNYISPLAEMPGTYNNYEEFQKAHKQFAKEGLKYLPFLKSFVEGNEKEIYGNFKKLDSLNAVDALAKYRRIQEAKYGKK